MSLKSGIGARFHAWLMSWAGPRYDVLVRERKTALLGALRGDILEIGPGTGPNLRYFISASRWIGVEPNPYMNPHLQKAMAQVAASTELRQGFAESLPVADASQDGVVSTLVLCSVVEPGRVLSEVMRVLRPGGVFVFFEHVAAPSGTFLRTIQQWLRPISVRVGDGCHPDRETWRIIEAAGFSRVEMEHFRLPLGHVSPQIAGTAVK